MKEGKFVNLFQKAKTFQYKTMHQNECAILITLTQTSFTRVHQLPDFVGSGTHWPESNEVSGHDKPYSQRPQQSIRQRSPLANDSEANTHKIPTQASYESEVACIFM